MDAQSAAAVALEFIATLPQEFQKIEFEKARAQTVRDELSRGIPFVKDFLAQLLDQSVQKPLATWKTIYESCVAWISFGIPNEYVSAPKTRF